MSKLKATGAGAWFASPWRYQLPNLISGPAVPVSVAPLRHWDRSNCVVEVKETVAIVIDRPNCEGFRIRLLNVFNRSCRKNISRTLRYAYSVIAASKDKLRAVRKNLNFRNLIQIHKNGYTARLR